MSMSAGAVAGADAMVFKQVQVKGKLAGLSPNSDLGTQMFFDQAPLSNAPAGLRLARQMRMTCSFLNFSRNVGPVPGEWSLAYLAGGTWEVAFPKCGMRVQNAIESPFLTVLDVLLNGLWSVLNPVMARTNNPAINKPLHDRQVIEIRARDGNIHGAIAKGNIESDSDVPSTRDLPRGKQRLLERWCDLVIAGKAPPGPTQFEALKTTSQRIRLRRPDELSHRSCAC
jgi:hypothetical protein